MNDTPSKAISQSTENNVRSALVKAFDTWTAPVDIRPDGVFGSVATIKCNGVTISSDDLDLEFDVPFDDDMEANEAEVIIYNLTDNTINRFKNNSEITIEAGYKGDTGVLFKGYVTKVTTTRTGADKRTKIKAIDDIKEHTVESLTFAKGTKASKILKKLLKKTKIPIAVFQVRRDHKYKDSETVDGDLMENIRKYATVCGISVYVSKGKIYARYIKNGDNINFNVSSDTGMIGSPSPYTEEITAEDFKETVNGYDIEMLLQHRMCAGAIINLNSKVANGTYRVCSGSHSFASWEAVTKIKVY